MKLTDIVQEADGERSWEGKPLELKDLVKYFPNNYKRAVNTVAKAGRLTFGGMEVFEKGGNNGPALERAIAECEQFLKDKDNTVDVNIDMDGTVADIDEHGTVTGDYPLDQFNLVYTGYTVRGDNLVLGFDVWLDEEIFNQDWDEQFEKTFGEEFDMEDPKHEKIFKKAHKEWQSFSFMGVMLEVDEAFSVSMDSMPLPDGFHKGLERMRSRMGLIDFDLS